MDNSAFLIGFSCGRNDFDRYVMNDRRPQFAAYKLESRFHDSLTEGGFEVKKLSFFPSSTFPNNRTLFFPYRKSSSLPFINLPGLKSISRFFVLLVTLVFNVLKKEKGESLTFFIYSLHSPFLLAVGFLKLFIKCKAIVMVPDLPEFMNVSSNRGRFFTLFKTIDVKLIKLALRCFDGFIFLTDNMAKRYFVWENKPYITIEAIAEAPPGDDQIISPELVDLVSNKVASDKKVVLYAGNLSSVYGVTSLIDAAEYFQENTELWLCGAGDAENIAIKAQEKLPIRYLGKVSMEDATFLQKNVDILVNPRPCEDAYTQYSFPSKLVEYMTMAVPVITTRLPGIPAEYGRYFNFFESITPLSIYSSIQQVLDNYEDCHEKAIEGKQFILDFKTKKPQGKRIYSFIQTIK